MRIIAGTHRGRRLRAPRGMATRPTTDRVREALFAILGDLSGVRVLDCYAGSGALGLEAASRGASRVTFLETGKEACHAIEHNVRELGFSDRCRIVTVPVERAAKGLVGEHFDLVLSDPPWPICHEAAQHVIVLVRGRLASDARVVLGHPVREVLDVHEGRGLVLEQTRSWGDSALTFLRASAEVAP